MPQTDASSGHVIVVYRVQTAWTFFGGISDLFITCMVWLALDDKSTPIVITLEGRTYSVVDVLKPLDSSLINLDDEE